MAARVTAIVDATLNVQYALEQLELQRGYLKTTLDPVTHARQLNTIAVAAQAVADALFREIHEKKSLLEKHPDSPKLRAQILELEKAQDASNVVAMYERRVADAARSDIPQLSIAERLASGAIKVVELAVRGWNGLTLSEATS